jgi:CheY-like chemotaxis protein
VLKTLTGVLSSQEAFDGAEALAAQPRAKALELLNTSRRTRAEIDRIEPYLVYAASERVPARVLVVDGGRAIACRTQQQLRLHGYAVKIACSCAEALTRLDPLVRCAIIDLFLPDGCGYELSVQLVRAQSSLRCIFVADRHKDSLPTDLQRLEPLVYKDSGLVALRVALANLLAQGSLNSADAARAQ